MALLSLTALLVLVILCCRSVRDPANAGLVNADPELQQYVRSVKLSAEDVRSKMRSMAKPVFERQVGVCLSALAPCGVCSCPWQRLHCLWH